VRVDLQVEGNELRLIIADNGRGLVNGERSAALNGHANGVNNMRSRIEKLNGRFEIAGEQGRGTVVRFVVPVI
jgi:signal transduction histidine kinase